MKNAREENIRSLKLVPTGLFDFEDYGEIAETICSVLDISELEAYRRLFCEAISRGYSVCSAASEFGVTPHVYDESMERLYCMTDAFVFELVVGHLQDNSQEIDERVADAVQQNTSPGDRMLVLGDGIGTDSLRFALAGYDVTYFDFDGPSADFAEYRFQEAGIRDDISTLHSPEDIPKNYFDTLICRRCLNTFRNPQRLLEISGTI